jgi:Tol biopolymer transport system component
LTLRYVIDGLRSLLFYNGTLDAANLEGGRRDSLWFLGGDGRSEAAGLEDAVWMVGVYLAGSAVLGYLISPVRDLLFVSNRDGDFEIYRVSFDTFGNATVLTQLTKHADNDFVPAVSPDGKKVAFASNRDGDFEIYIMRAVPESATNVPVKLTRNAAADYAPDCSPDGRRIVFESNRDGDSDIFVMNSDGTKQAKVTMNTDRDGTPVYSPDGKKIAFASNRDAITDIWRMRVDGTHPVNITNNNSSDAPLIFDPLPDWQPLP